jgi:hypothetical protein
MINRKHFAWVTVRCIDCREEYNREVTDTGTQLCPDCKDYYSCCKCGKGTPHVDIIYNKENETYWCVSCADIDNNREG